MTASCVFTGFFFFGFFFRKMPSMLELWSYIFSFHGMMCGPFCFYKDYVAFIDGSNYSQGDAVGFQSECLPPSSLARDLNVFASTSLGNCVWNLHSSQPRQWKYSWDWLELLNLRWLTKGKSRCFKIVRCHKSSTVALIVTRAPSNEFAWGVGWRGWFTTYHVSCTCM